MAIVHSDVAVTLLGGGVLGDGDMQVALARASRLVAADGGADRALAEGLTPEAIIGDMDGIGAAADRFADRMHRIAEQDSTDFEKALRNIDAPLVLAVGFTGGRTDHELAVFHVLQRHPDRRCLIIGSESITFLCPPSLTLDLEVGMPFSLFPLGAVSVESEGLRWPTRGIDFGPDRRIGTSNEVVGPVALRAEAPLMLVILPRSALDTAIAALTDTTPHWQPRNRSAST